MFDCWNIERLVPSVKDDDKGYTNVMINSQKGYDLFKKFQSKLQWWETDINEAIKYDGVMLSDKVKKPSQRSNFFLDANMLSINVLGEKYTPIPIKTIMKEYLKNMLLRLHVLQL